ncbi:uncharacterized protein KY384_000920 [Bacidia gigantensis]|uniref:uncharacterized protein n=1 Tax=Bacidia gigantensis TaxID=2732470 RepID=UPI001D044639|nr:uncharacterized protein KY384_000920 [Bacidia gigantensis]KAG8534077.1 hypothetical protein KY384_000920 [Bacidia gigantensis]
MLSHLSLLALLSSPAFSATLSRRDAAFQNVPDHATTPDNKYTEGDISTSSSNQYFIDIERQNLAKGIASPVPPEIYGARSIDIPFALLNFGNVNFFKNGQFADPEPADTDPWDPNKTDYSSNSACGIPDNGKQSMTQHNPPTPLSPSSTSGTISPHPRPITIRTYWVSHVAIHPYWLKYAPENLGLSRYCMQDVCLSLWNNTGTPIKGAADIQVKVTDICSTDPKDPNYCATPADIMIDRRKAMLLWHDTTAKTEEESAALKNGKAYPNKIFWYFSKCIQDGLPQQSYNHSGNWFAEPPLPLNTLWGQQKTTGQHTNNVEHGAYKKAGLPEYAMGAWLTNDTLRDERVFKIPDGWETEVPEWCPVAGGKGHGHPTGKACTGSATAVVQRRGWLSWFA